MIRYTLKCRDAHEFESWFHSAAAFDALRKAGQLACPECGASDVDKALMAPRVGNGGSAAPATPAPEHPLAVLRRRIEAHSDYVGRDFVREARAMHEGDTPQRSIYGEAAPREAKKLIEDGIPIAPLPFIPKAKAN